MNLPERNYATLDAMSVIGSLVIVAGVVVGLFAYDLDPAVAPIVSALATAILGIPVSYGAFRWGSSVGAKNAQQQAGVSAVQAADQVAQAADDEAARIKDPTP
jgi:hypothetical protein